MMLHTWIDEIAGNDSRLHKEQMLSKILSLAKLGDASSSMLLNMVHYTYNPYVTFGVKQVQNTSNVTDAENPWSEFIELLKNLHQRRITGDAARDAIADISKRFDSLEWNKVCAPVIRRDLRAGISEKTFNKVCKNTQYAIPVFGCQLATSCEDRPEMRGQKRLEPKLDGVRVLMTVLPVEGVQVISYSRNGKVFDNFTHIEHQIALYASRLMATSTALVNGFVLDGEVVGKSFQELMRQARRKENVQALDSVFHVFDVIPLQDFTRGFWNAPLSKRIDILEKMRPTFDYLDHVQLLDHLMVDLDTAAGKDQLERYAQDQVAAGYEGIMIKSMAAPYECKRNTFWLKWKPTITVDLEITDVEEGTGRNAGRLGALVCSGTDHGKTISVNVGSGFSDADRDSYWSSRGDIIGRTVEIMADAVTQNQDGTYSLRFPRFIRFRDDK